MSKNVASTDNDARIIAESCGLGVEENVEQLTQRITAYANQRYVEGLKRAAKEACDACDNEERYGLARKIQGSTRWWHGQHACTAGGIHALLAETNRKVGEGNDG